MRNPDFNNLLAVLNRQKPSRPTLFEFFMNDPLHRVFAGNAIADMTDPLAPYRTVVHSFRNAGYDYALIPLSPDTLNFPCPHMERKASLSMGDGAVIFDKPTFNAYPWKSPDPAGYAYFNALAPEIPAGMKLIGHGPSGIYENVAVLLGYENLCSLVYENEDFVFEVFEAVGSLFVEHYRLLSKFDCIGALLCSDDWGFATQTLLSPDMMRKFVFPWHKKVVETIHAAGKPAILHSCGQLESIMDDIIDDIQYDGKHSYEDKILPVEQAYEKWHDRIAILGGMDIDFMSRSTPEAIFERSKAMLDRTASRGGYALGTGNSVPEYVPIENFRAMISAVTGAGPSVTQPPLKSAVMA